MDSAQLDAAIAEKFFGWKWMAFVDTPTKAHPEYPRDVRVRRFFSSESLSGTSWIKFFGDRGGEQATGDEPLAYCYCSSGGPQRVPHFSGDESAAVQMEWQICTRGLWERYAAELWESVDRFAEPDVDEGCLSGPSCRTRCLAALSVVDKE